MMSNNKQSEEKKKSLKYIEISENAARAYKRKTDAVT